jgi:phosphonoacetate hydrolase
MNMAGERSSVPINGVTYRWPREPVVVVCIDGGDPEYLESGIERGLLPNVDRFQREGYHTIARGTMPSFTCPNNMSIATGAPASIHGVSGNYHLDRRSGRPVAMTGPEMLRTRTVLAEFALHGASVVCITAKDKLRAQLGKDMPVAAGQAVNFSAQYADRCSLTEHGIQDALALVGRPCPDMYSADLSLFVLDAGIQLLRERKPQLMYLSLTDFVQHAYAPGHPVADQFYGELDARFGELDALGAIVALTADHGMSDMADERGEPRVIWLQEELDRACGAGSTTVICPITDAFVGHHGALGGFVRVYCHGGPSSGSIEGVLRSLKGIAKVWTRDEAVRELDLPWDVEADFAVMGGEGMALGTRPELHDVGALRGQRLRSHGSIWEADVPLILSRPLTADYADRAARGALGSHQVFDFAVNGVADG